MEAACRDRTDLDWFDERVLVDHARVCGECPVRSECVMDALDQRPDCDWGVRAGTSRLDRLAIRRGAMEPWAIWERQGHPYPNAHEEARRG
jgi:hypothetical protein